MLATTRLPSNFKIVIKLGWILNFIFFTFLWLNSGGWDPRVYFEALNITYTTLQYTRGSTLRVDFRNRCTVPGISMDITYLTIYHNFCPGIPAMNRHQLPVLPVIICIFPESDWSWNHCFHLCGLELLTYYISIFVNMLWKPWIWKIIQHILPIISLSSSLATKFVDWDFAGIALLATQPRIVTCGRTIEQ